MTSYKLNQLILTIVKSSTTSGAFFIPYRDDDQPEQKANSNIYVNNDHISS